MSSENTQSFSEKTGVYLRHAKAVTLYALNPAHLLKEEKKHKWYLFLILPAVGWMFFFMQVGLDKGDSFYVSAGNIVFISFLGLATGYATVAGIGALVTYILGKMKTEIRYDQITSCIALSHTYMVMSLVMGFIYRMFGASSSATFGIAGLMCTLLPIYSGLRTLGRGRSFFAPLMATLIGALLLIVWKFLMIIPL